MPQNEGLKNAEKAEYDSMVSQISPKPTYLKNFLWAFVIGGLICMTGQIILNSLIKSGMDLKAAGSMTSVILIFLAALFTGLGLYDELAKKAGAGTIVPITGFANAIVASAMEFKREGYIFGVGARIFTVAGPTLVFGFVISVIIGLIKFLI
ncbi:MAG: stage V sporulation protein AC [Syntrophomonadaceae bacterium]|jgi:stage V sporulation protein AC|nr:stage V sporulation protein AC [Syntrophomonadaceae bacterium]